MSETRETPEPRYVIAWTSRARILFGPPTESGVGEMSWPRDEAQRLCDEANREAPHAVSLAALGCRTRPREEGDAVMGDNPKVEPDVSGRTWWCNSHQRIATEVRSYPDRICHVCARNLGGILLPCSCVDVTDLIEILPDDAEEARA